MSIQMIGIDHKKAGVEEREQFSFTKKSGKEAMEFIKSQPQVTGCVLLSTCNRMELYVNQENMQEKEDLYALLARCKGITTEKHRELFVEREGAEVVSHLFYLTAGLKSKIMGEDQILTQVKDALAQAREAEALDGALEVLFRRAITAGKKVKTEVSLDKENHSAADLAIKALKDKGFSPEGKKCLVIGNGMMGKITALALKEEGADVTVTVRQYKSGMVEIPEGCKRINYGERYELLGECDLVFSATASPNITLDRKHIEELHLKRPMIFIDLAVPRDIDPGIRELQGMSLYDIDDFSIDEKSEHMLMQYKKAAAILEDGAAEYISWLECRQFLPIIESISSKAAEDVGWRMGKELKAIKEQKDQMISKKAAKEASEKVIKHLLFLLRDELEPEQFRNCLEILQEGDQ